MLVADEVNARCWGCKFSYNPNLCFFFSFLSFGFQLWQADTKYLSAVRSRIAEYSFEELGFSHFARLTFRVGFLMQSFVDWTGYNLLEYTYCFRDLG